MQSVVIFILQYLTLVAQGDAYRFKIFYAIGCVCCFLFLILIFNQLISVLTNTESCTVYEESYSGFAWFVCWLLPWSN